MTENTKVAIVCDTHFGARSDSKVFRKYFVQFFTDVFFPYLEKHDIKRVIHLGDLLDRRKFVNFQTLQAVKQYFIDECAKRGIKIDLIIGNHDVFFKNTNDLNSPKELFGDEDTLTIHTEPTEIDLFGVKIALLPWVNSENADKAETFLNGTTANILMGHLEVNGFFMAPGMACKDGFDVTRFSKFDMVFSGHFHQRHSFSNVFYLGTPYQITFGDCGEVKGFHTFDPTTQKKEFVPNPHDMFHMVKYNDVTHKYNINEIDFSKYANKYVRLTVEKKTKPFAYDSFLTAMYEACPANLTIVEDLTPDEDDGEDGDIDLTQDTLTIINKEIDGIEDLDDPARLKTLVAELHKEAIELDIV